MTLAAVCCHFNPCNFKRPVENYLRFREAFKGCPLFTVEVSYNNKFVLPAEWQLQAKRENIMWQKEHLLNFAISRLPSEFDQVAWIDADLLFLNPNWAAETSCLLRKHSVVQLYENIHYLNKTGNQIRTVESWAAQYRKGQVGMGQPGGAWAARRSLLTMHPMYSFDVAGAGDNRWADACTGISNGHTYKISTEAMNRSCREWAAEMFMQIKGDIWPVTGDILHLFHGTRANRNYLERTYILTRGEFDPHRDIRIGKNHLLEWATDKPVMHQEVRDYFLSRKEDD